MHFLKFVKKIFKDFHKKYELLQDS